MTAYWGATFGGLILLTLYGLNNQQQLLILPTRAFRKMQYHPFSATGEGKRHRHFYLPVADTLHIPSLNYFLCLCDEEVKENDKSGGVNLQFIYCINGSFLWDPFNPSLVTDWRNDSLGPCEGRYEARDLHRRRMKESVAVFIFC